MNPYDLKFKAVFIVRQYDCIRIVSTHFLISVILHGWLYYFYTDENICIQTNEIACQYKLMSIYNFINMSQPANFKCLEK